MARPGLTITRPRQPRLRLRDIKVIDGQEYRLVRPAPPRDPNAPRLRPVYLELGTSPSAFPLNEWCFEGRIVLPPQQVTVREGKIPMSRIIVGYRENLPVRENGRRPCRIVQAKLTAFGDLAVALLESYRQGDHVRCWGGFASWMQRMGVSFCAVLQRIEMVERAVEAATPSESGLAVDLTDTGAVLKAAIGG